MHRQPTRRTGETFWRSPKLRQTSARPTLQVGKIWPTGIEANVETIPAHEAFVKTGVIIVILVFCGVLIAGVTVHAMITGNQGRLNFVLDTAWKVVIGFGIWAVATTQRWDSMKAVLWKTIRTLKE